jgi:ABC-type branched-subunit amino acid transport system ATPase component
VSASSEGVAKFAPGEPLLKVEGVRKRFGGLHVLDGISTIVEAGKIQGIIGPNGAGKSTLFDVISGIVRPDSGRIIFDGVELGRRPQYAVASLGIGRTFQLARVFRELTVLENMLVPAIEQRQPIRESESRARELLQLAKLQPVMNNRAAEISGGQQKILEFLRLLMNRPKLLLLDEPFNGVHPALISQFIELIQRVNRESGASVLLVSHEINHIMRLCDSVCVLNAGKEIAYGSPEQVRANPLVIEAYLGR